MIHINAGGHWVLAHAIKDGGFLVDDSGQAPKPYTLKGNGLTKRGTDTVEGLAILPINSEMSSWP